MAKAEQFLKSAKVTLAAEVLDACASLCYHAIFWAAIAMLHYVGVRRERWRHDELRQMFGLECVKKRELFPPEYGEWIGELYDLRNDAVYKLVSVTTKKAEHTLRKADEFVQRAKEVCR